MQNQFSFIANAHPSVIEAMYNDFKSDVNKVDPEYVKFFAGFDFAVAKESSSGGSSAASFSSDEFKVYKLIHTYRQFGHLLSDTNPIKKRKDRGIKVDIASFGLTDKHLTQRFSVSSEIGLSNASLQEIINKLNQAYISKIGYEFQSVRVEEELNWLHDAAEKRYAERKYSIDQKMKALKGLNKAVVFEEFLGKKYIGEKRFSLEGGESTIPALETIIESAAKHGTKEVILGMAHRGRLNVLVNILQKTYENIFNEFDGTNIDETAGDGDVKYHKGYQTIYPTPHGEIYLNLQANPSHLEAVNPVVLGFARAKADILYEKDYSKVLPIIIHGDAAVAGQGIGQEMIQMSQLRGYGNHGTIHFVINNQIGFTTDFDDARSSDYSTAIANMLNCPVFHVNGDSVEDVIYVCELAAEYRAKFKKDVFVDMVCYRKHGHNESDDPKYTQPEMYSIIAKKKNPRDIYAELLASQGTTEADLVKKMDKELYDNLQDRLNKVKEETKDYKYRHHEKAWMQLVKARGADFEASPKTNISQKDFEEIATKICTYPAGFSPLKKVEKQLADWKSRMLEKQELDWQAGELLAYASLLKDGKTVRLSGEDVKRGTFSHRHASIFDQNNGTEFCRLSQISKNQATMQIYNSLLSEYAVLGYEFGYSIASPDQLVIWEAQFGDFSNGAQIIIDQFIMSSETKWKVGSGMVLLLPHGYEGQGPEHSSARMERFLQQCAEFNVQVCNITTPANYFHAIRRQLARNFRTPLVIMSPKSLLRHPKCVSPAADITGGGFQELIDDAQADVKKVKRVLHCTGKIYYELLAKKEEDKRDDIAIIRLEQIYPIPIQQLENVFSKYKSAEHVWVQEEPANMGAWTYLLDRQFRMKGEVVYKLVARKTSSSPATGNKKQHAIEVQDLMNRAFGK
jgi:2-oxoglutarate dehydrogenase E1 component